MFCSLRDQLSFPKQGQWDPKLVGSSGEELFKGGRKRLGPKAPVEERNMPGYHSRWEGIMVLVKDTVVYK